MHYDAFSSGANRLAREGQFARGKMPAGSDSNVFLSTVPATHRDRALALSVAAISAILFIIAVPFAGTPLAPVPAFVASYQSALAVNDLITAILLLSQFVILRTRALLLLAGGYLFAAAAAIVHALTFPGLFAPSGLLGAGSQTTVWLYMIWHGVFPLCVIGYALSKSDKGGTAVRMSSTTAILTSIAAVVLLMAAGTWIVTAGHDFLPVLLRGGRYTSHDDRRRVFGLGPEPRCADRAVVPPAAKRPRRLAHGGDVRLAVRYRPVGHPQRVALRPWLLSRPHLRPLRGKLRAGDSANRQRQPSGTIIEIARDHTPAGCHRSRVLADCA